MATTYDIGDKPRISVTFTDLTGSVGDPTGVTLRVKPPRGAASTLFTYGVDAALVRSGVGTYYLDYQIFTEGRHEYRWEGTGALQTANEGVFDVRKRRVS